MQDTFVRTPMSLAEQEQLIPYFETGLAWATGTISFDGVLGRFGQPKKFDDPGVTTVDYTYFLQNNVSIDFLFNRLHLVDGQPSVKTVFIDIDSLTTTNIPKESYESRLGLRRVVHGELIDGVRTERGHYFSPTGVFGGGDPNVVDFVYRQPLPPDSLYDVYITVTYEGKFEHDGPEFKSLQNPTNLRSIRITRWYLRPDELEQRRLAKRQKYGEMRLCTGMVCPETGLWEGWTEKGPTDLLVVYKGDLFQQGRLTRNPDHRDWYRFADAQWMWLREEKGNRYLV